LWRIPDAAMLEARTLHDAHEEVTMAINPIERAQMLKALASETTEAIGALADSGEVAPGSAVFDAVAKLAIQANGISNVLVEMLSELRTR
jgi:hypothetical protein